MTHSLNFIDPAIDPGALHRHLTEIVESAEFRGSRRCCLFLRFVVEHAISGHLDSLKERIIGMELFGRSPSYDTHQDAIVRVTASDVRKRLAQFYSRYGYRSDYQVSLPSGSYIPVVIRKAADGDERNGSDAEHDLRSAHQRLAVEHEGAALASSVSAPELPHREIRGTHIWLGCGVLLTILSLAVAVSRVPSFADRKAADLKASDRLSVLPWSAFFAAPHGTQIILSDPNIAEIQGFTGGELSVSDYANHRYIPDPNALSPEILWFCRTILRGDKAAAIDTPIAVHIAELAQARSVKIAVHSARGIELADLRTDDNFVLLGSPRTNPWSQLFTDQLDFQFVFAKRTMPEIIRNVHPRPHELPVYAPTAPGWATGESYAIVALVQNPDQAGQVLLLAGENAEGTQAAGRLVTDLPRLSSTLQRCGIPPGGPLRHFELLLHVNMMAGSPSNVDVVACHILSGGSAT